MLEIISEFVIKEQAIGQFELAFGPGGAWSKLFSGCDGYRGTTVLRDQDEPQRYLVVDLWEERDQQIQAITEHPAEYADLQIDFAAWCESTAALGAFSVLAQATVRPRGRSRDTRRRGRRVP